MNDLSLMPVSTNVAFEAKRPRLLTESPQKLAKEITQAKEKLFESKVVSKNASDAIKASVTPQVTNAKNLENLAPDVLEFVEKSQAEIQRLGLLVDDDAKEIARRFTELGDDASFKIRDELYEEMKKKGYDYLEGETPIKLSAQPNEALLNIVNKYRPEYGRNLLYERALLMLKDRGVMSCK